MNIAAQLCGIDVDRRFLTTSARPGLPVGWILLRITIRCAGVSRLFVGAGLVAAEIVDGTVYEAIDITPRTADHHRQINSSDTCRVKGRLLHE